MGWFIISPDVRFRVCIPFAIAFVWAYFVREFCGSSVVLFPFSSLLWHPGHSERARSITAAKLSIWTAIAKVADKEKMTEGQQ